MRVYGVTGLVANNKDTANKDPEIHESNLYKRVKFAVIEGVS